MPITLETPALLGLLTKARKYEQMRDIEAQKELLEVFWNDSAFDPDTDNLPVEIQAEVFRMCGKFLSACGKAKKIPGYQERSKNLLLKSIELFDAVNNAEKSALAKCQLALSYYQDGRIGEADIYLEEAEAVFDGASSNDYFLEIQANRLFILSERSRSDECFQIIKQFAPLVEQSASPYLQIMFFNQCGFVSDNAGLFETSENFYLRALRTATENSARRVAGMILNNLAFAVRNLGRFDDVRKYINEAVSIAGSLNDTGWLANYLDTRALIEFDCGEYKKALQTIDEALQISGGTGDAVAHTEALWTKITILSAMKKHIAAELVFAELIEIASVQIDENRAGLYIEKFAALNAGKTKPTGNFRAEISRFYPPDGLQMSGLPEGDYRLFYVPATKSEILDFNEDLIVCALTQKKPNPVVVICGDKFLIGDLVRDAAMNLIVLYTGANFTEPVCVSPMEAKIEGSISLVAPLKGQEKGILCFNKFR